MSSASFLALGDSYTIGEAVAPLDRWPVQLARMLSARGIAMAEPRVIAKTGWTTDELATALDEARLDVPAVPVDGGAPPAGPRARSLVSLLIGVNDQYRGQPPAGYQARFRTLLARAVALAGARPGRVMVLSIPDWSVTPFAAGRDRARIASEIDAFNRIAREETDRAGARWVDVTTISRAPHADWLAHDGLHPAPGQYEAWAVAALPAAMAALGA